MLDLIEQHQATNIIINATATAAIISQSTNLKLKKSQSLKLARKKLSKG